MQFAQRYKQQDFTARFILNSSSSWSFQYTPSYLVFNLIGWDSFRALLEALYASMSALQTSSPGLSSLPERVVSTVSISIFQFHVDLCVTCSLPTCLTSVTSSLCLRSKVHVCHQLHVPLLGACMLILDRIQGSTPGSAGNFDILPFAPSISRIHLCQEFHASESEFKFELIIVDKTGNKCSTSQSQIMKSGDPASSLGLGDHGSQPCSTCIIICINGIVPTAHGYSNACNSKKKKGF